MSPSRVERLRRVSLFADLPDAALEALASRLQPHRVDRGAAVYRRGDTGASLYVVARGRVKIVLSSDDGKEAVVNLRGPGDYLGEISLLDDQVHGADAIAMEPTCLLTLERATFQQLLVEHPGIAATLLAELSRRVRRNANSMRDANFLDVPGRLAQTLLQLASSHGRPGPDGIVVEPRFTQAELAGLVGASRESVNKWMRFYGRHGFIRVDRGRITVLQPEGLRRRVY